MSLMPWELTKSTNSKRSLFFKKRQIYTDPMLGPVPTPEGEKPGEKQPFCWQGTNSKRDGNSTELCSGLPSQAWLLCIFSGLLVWTPYSQWQMHPGLSPGKAHPLSAESLSPSALVPLSWVSEGNSLSLVFSLISPIGCLSPSLVFFFFPPSFNY